MKYLVRGFTANRVNVYSIVIESDKGMKNAFNTGKKLIIENNPLAIILFFTFQSIRKWELLTVNLDQSL